MSWRTGRGERPRAGFTAQVIARYLPMRISAVAGSEGADAISERRASLGELPRQPVWPRSGSGWFRSELKEKRNLLPNCDSSARNQHPDRSHTPALPFPRASA